MTEWERCWLEISVVTWAIVIVVVVAVVLVLA